MEDRHHRDKEREDARKGERGETITPLGGGNCHDS